MTQDAAAAPEGAFVSTRWSLIQRAARHDREDLGDKERAETGEALNQLCRLYWRPVYAFARSWGKPPDEAADLTQSFFLELLQKRLLAREDLGKTKFRTFLLKRFKYLISNDFRRRTAKKRGGADQDFPLEIEDAEAAIATARATGSDPAEAYDRSWAAELVRRTLAILEAEHAKRHPDLPFAALRGHLPGGSAHERIPYRTLQERHGLASEGAVKQIVHRLNLRLREVFYGCVADTVAEPGEVEGEVRYLLQVLSGE
ncbi:MAG: sigma-70 family RNA polymerase sigma factor [Verrucomicrobiales bacterium]|nr:sigma-70 family RNA polymerase sigma factor [Verrucomicrobiales bacterium]MCP5528150.1 sigma-70 family RNA polymerase sigma factor [Verrucomicrobiales bacterium]